MEPGADEEGSVSMNSSVGSNREELEKWKEIYEALEYDAVWGPEEDEELLQDIKEVAFPPDKITHSFVGGIPFPIAKKRFGERTPPVELYRSIRKRIIVIRCRYETYCLFLKEPGIKWNPRIRCVVTNHAYYYREKKETVLEHYFRTTGLPGYEDLHQFFGVQRAPLFVEEIHPTNK